MKEDLSYDSLSDDHAERLANAYTQIGVVYKEAGYESLERIAALQAAWFRTKSQKGIAPL